MDNLFQPVLQGLLNTELDNMLNYDRCAHNSKTNNSRNGFCKEKKVQTRYGTVTLKTPRDRNLLLSLKAKTSLANLKK